MRLLLLLYLVFSPLLSDFSSPQFPPEGRTPLDKFLLVKPFTRWINKFQTLGSVLTTMNEIRLTSDAKGMTGAIWTKETIGLNAFTIEARLRISSSRTVVADGMGIWFTEKMSLGNAYGIKPFFTGFGVVLDIYDNTNYRKTPFLGLVASNGTSALNDDDNGKQLTLDSCRVYESGSLIREANHNSRESIAILIEYLPGKMGIYYKLEHDLDWQPCLTYNNIFIPNYFYLGVSASTGDLTAQQDLLSLKVFDLPIDMTVKARSSMHFEQTKTDEGEKKTSEGSKIFWVLFFTIAFFIVIGGLIMIIKPDLIPGTQASIDKKKRFY